MKKKITLVATSVLLVAAMVIGGTLAYFTDADKDVNVMTAGNVDIKQNETDRNGEAYEDGQALLPAVYLKKDANGEYTVPYMPATKYEGPGGYGPQNVDGKEMWYTGTMANTTGSGNLKIYDDNIENEIGKVISVTNKGALPAYIRTIILMENTADNAILDKVHVFYCNNDGQGLQWVVDSASNKDVLVDIDGTSYSIAVCTYNTALAAGATSSPSLMQLFLNPSADNAWFTLLGDSKFSVIALSQAVQTTGFDTAAQALNAAFGEVTAANVADWVAKTEIQTTGDANIVADVTP